jgi:hypothetical protein
VLFGLAIAPRATGKLASMMEGVYSWKARYLPGQQ